MGKIKLSDTQKEATRLLKRDGAFIISTSKGTWIGGGYGERVSAATYDALCKLGIYDRLNRRLTDLGKSIDLK